MNPLIIFMGRPGSGKGVQSEMLSKALGLPVFSTGAEVRKTALEDTLLGKRIKEISDIGGLTPFWFASYLFEKALFVLKDDESLIFEGVGRKLGEAQLFAEIASWLGRDFRVIYLEVCEETVGQRLEKRRETSGRPDDQGEKLENRFKHYNEETLPALEYFKSLGKVIEIDGEPDADTVHAHVLESSKPFA